MGEIELEITPSVVTLRVQGAISTKDYMSFVDEKHHLWGVGPTIIVDFSDADISSWTVADVREVARRFSSKEPRTALSFLIAPSTHQYGLLRAFEIHSEIAEAAANYRVCRSWDEVKRLCADVP
jgi:hypothetical protein